MRPRLSKLWFTLALPATLAALAWSGGIATTIASITRYELTPGKPSTPPANWPIAATLNPAIDRPTLVVSIHPRCPCTAATLSQLNTIITNAKVQPRTYILLTVLPNASAEWTDSENSRLAHAIPRTTVLLDPDGALAATFGTTTSGHVLAYSDTGKLRFSGGLTAVRGKVSPCTGADALAALLNDSTPAQTTTPVYGCTLIRNCDDHAPAEGTNP